MEDYSPDDRRTEIEGRLAETREKIKKTQDTIDAGGDFDALLQLLKRLSKQEAQFKRQLEAEHAKRNAPVATDAQREAASITQRMAGLEGDELRALREQLRVRIRQLCKHIRVWIDGDRIRRACVADVEFADGKHRMFVVRTDRGKPTITAGTDAPVSTARFDFDRITKRLLDNAALGAAGDNHATRPVLPLEKSLYDLARPKTVVVHVAGTLPA